MMVFEPLMVNLLSVLDVSRGFSLTIHLPFLSAVVATVRLAKDTRTFSPGDAVPHIGTHNSRCRIILSPKIEGTSTLANVTDGSTKAHIAINIVLKLFCIFPSVVLFWTAGDLNPVDLSKQFLFTSQLPEKSLKRLEQTCLLIAADIVTGAFDMNDLAVLQQFDNFLVFLPVGAPSVGFEDQCRSGDLGKQLTHGRAAASTSQRGVGVMEPL
ncbi:MAG: hypothetical protein IIC50_16285 [Planctomycetes bacterium]|nr:hypothetical protein [Planctomycetota bacterium]